MEKPTQLELKHLAAYFPYGLKLYDLVDRKVIDCISLHKSDSDGEVLEFYAPDEKPNSDWLPINSDSVKPILRPLSDLNTEFGNQSKTYNYVMQEETGWKIGDFAEVLPDYSKCIADCYLVMQWLFSNHFDVFGLIDAGLAVDINTLPNAK